MKIVGQPAIPAWERLRDLRPRLRQDLQGQWHRYRGQYWWVILDPLGGRSFRFNTASERLLAALDGKRTLGDIQSVMDDVPPQQIISLLTRLYTADLLHGSLPDDLCRLFENLSGQGMTRTRRTLNPLAWRIPLGDPDLWLESRLELVRPLFSRSMLIAWLVLVSSAALVAGMHWPELSANAADRVLSPRNLVLLWLLFPLVKLMHELGHAFAVKVRGGEVHEFGIMLLVLVPVPYVDASAASAFPERRWRLLAAAAGVMVEMLLATLALLVWLRVEPGSVPSVVAYNTLVIGVLTLFVNGNPLLRYDGYYAFSDLIDIPNLAARSRACLAYLVQRYVYGLNDVTSCVADRRERWWLLGYGISSGIFRLVIVTAILWYLLNHYFIIGTLLAVWVTVSYFIGPMLQHTGFLLFSSRLYRRRRRPLCITSGLLVLVLLVSGVIPMPYSTQVQGVVWIPERGQIRAQAEGFVKTVAVAPGEQVDTGQLVVELENPELEMRVALLRAQLDEWQARQLAARNTNLEEVESAGDRIHNLQAAFHEAQQDMQHLKLLSSVNGQVVLPDVTDLPGRYVQRGDLLGYVVTQEPATVRTAIPQKDASLIQSDLQEIRVRLASRPEILPATLVRHTPAAGNRLPSPVLGQPAGGPFAVDPEDRQGVSTTEKFFQVDVQLQKAGELRIGERAWVRLEHSHTPLLKQWYTVLRSLWMGRVQA